MLILNILWMKRGYFMGKAELFFIDVSKVFLDSLRSFAAGARSLLDIFVDEWRLRRLRDLRRYQNELKAGLNYELGEVELSCARSRALVRADYRKLIDAAANKIKRLEAGE